MRLWTLHPQYLDSRGLVALWREGLLAQKVLQGLTTGYRQHPQLLRFRASTHPLSAIAVYLEAVAAEARCRGYHFDESKIIGAPIPLKLAATRGQMQCERDHLLAKLRARAPEQAVVFAQVQRLKPHPLFRVVAGPVAHWERNQAAKDD